MGKVVTQEDLFTVLRSYEERLARLERAVYLLSANPPPPEPEPPETP